MDLGQPGNERNDAIGVAKRNGKTEVVSLLERFKGNPAQTRNEMRVALGWLMRWQPRSSPWWSFSVMAC